MDPKIAKKTQDSLGKYIKKPPLTEKLLAKPPFRFLHDIMTSVIKTTGVMNGLYPESDLNSENVKDRESKIAFLQKAVDYVCNATGKQLSVKPAKVVAGHEPEKTNEFLQALASAIGAKGDNDSIIDSVNNKGKSSGKKEEKEEKPREREKSSDRRKRDDEKKSRDREEKDRSKDRDERRHRDRDDKHKERDDKHRDKDEKHRDKDEKHRDRDDKHRDRDDKHRDRDDKHRDRDRERDRESRHKSGRTRYNELDSLQGKISDPRMKQTVNTDTDSDVPPSDEDFYDKGDLPGNATFAVMNPRQVFGQQESEDVVRPIPRHASTYQEIRRAVDSDEADDYGIDVDDDNDEINDDDEFDDFFAAAAADHEAQSERLPQSGRPKGARQRRGKRESDSDTSKQQPSDEPNTQYVSEENSHEDTGAIIINKTEKAAKTVIEKTPVKSRIELNKRSVTGVDKKGNKGVRDTKVVEHVTERNSKKTAGKGPKTSTPKSSPLSPKRDVQNLRKNADNLTGLHRTPKYGEVTHSPNTQHVEKQMSRNETQVKPLNKRGAMSTEQSKKRMTESGQLRYKSSNSKLKFKCERRRESLEDSADIYSTDGDSHSIVGGGGREPSSGKGNRGKGNKKVEHRKSLEQEITSEQGKGPKKNKLKQKYRNDDYAHDKVKGRYDEGKENETSETNGTEDKVDHRRRDENKSGSRRRKSEEKRGHGKEEKDDRYYEKKRPTGLGDRRKRSSFTAVAEINNQKREDEGKENDAPKDSTVMNGDHKPESDAGEESPRINDAPAKMQRPSSAKGSRRRMEDAHLSSEEDVPAGGQDQTMGDDDQPQMAGRLARPSSARPAPPKRKDDIVQQEPAMRLGSGKPQNLILDDGDSDEDETFVVEDAAPPSPKQEQAQPMAGDDDDDDDHGGLVKKIMETKKEYEQPRDTKIERPTISDAQRRKQREAVQREIDKLRGSIQTLTRSANPLGKIMDYVQEDLDSMQKELEKWKNENKEHSLALKREKAITERAVEPLKVQLSEVDQAIKDQLDLIGAVKSNTIRNDQKIEKMLRTIAKS